MHRQLNDQHLWRKQIKDHPNYMFNLNWRECATPFRKATVGGKLSAVNGAIDPLNRSTVCTFLLEPVHGKPLWLQRLP
jgi:hypothetical protein